MTQPQPGGPTVELNLQLETAEALHAALEDLLDRGTENPASVELEKAYRVLAWRILAVKGEESGLVGRMAAIAHESRTVEEYEAARDEALGPIIGGLENPENRDP